MNDSVGNSQALFDLAPSQIPEWYVAQVAPDSPVYNISFNHFFFTGIKESIFVKAWQILLDKNDIFRLRFTIKDGIPKQYLTAPVKLDIASVLIDCTDIPPSEIEIEQNKLAEKYAVEPFDLSNEAAFRLHLVKYGNAEYQLIFTIHHIIWDESSTINLIKNFINIYTQLSLTSVVVFPDPPCKFVDYAQSIHNKIVEGDFDKQKSYWLSVFKEVPECFNIPSDFSRKAIQSYVGDTINAWLKKETVYAVQNYCVSNNITIFIYFISVLALYCHRMTGATDIVIGCPIAGRESSNQDLLGCFAVPVPLRIKFDNISTFFDLITEVKAKSLEGLENYQYPCVKVIEQLVHDKDLSRPKLFSIMSGVQNNKSDYMEIEFCGARLYPKSVFSAENHGARFDIAIGLDPVGSDIKFFCTYSTDLFRKKTIFRMMQTIEGLLLEIASQEKNSYRKITDFDILLPEDRQKILSEFSQGEHLASDCESILELYSKKVKELKDRTAVFDNNDSKITYRQFHQKVINIVAVLQENAVQPGDKIAVILNYTYDVPVTLFAIWWVGACFVPLSIEAPSEFNQRIVEILDINLIMTNDNLSSYEKLFSNNKKIVNVCSTSNKILRNDDLELDYCSNLADRDAYIIFTSGTTGNPKGIPITHRNLAHTILSTQSTHPLTCEDNILCSTPYIFDAAFLEIVWPLITGASITIPNFNMRKDIKHFLTLIKSYDITVIQVVPTLLEEFCRVLERSPVSQETLKKIRLVICGSAPLTRSLLSKAKLYFDGDICNHYGPTEVTIDATHFNCKKEFDGDIVPLGQPIPNVSVFVVDEAMNVVPIGVKGEICIASPGNAKHYIGVGSEKKLSCGDIDLGDNNILSVYKTGDVGSFHDDGQLYFSTRVDGQCKINGNRIEVDFIAAKFEESQFVKVAHVMVAAGKQLAAFLALDDDSLVSFDSPVGCITQFSVEHRLDLKFKMEKIHRSIWPSYFTGSKILRKYWNRLYVLFPQYQVCLLDSRGDIVCVGNSIPIYLKDGLSSAPKTWDEGVEMGFRQYEQGIKPNALLGLSGIVTNRFQGHGLSQFIVRSFRQLASCYGLDTFLGPVRPIGMNQHNITDVHKWAEQVDEKGESLDTWLRTHYRLGAKLLSVVQNSQHVDGSITEWETWLNTSLSNKTYYHDNSLLGILTVSHDKEYAEYFDPSIWVAHTDLLKSQPEKKLISVREIKSILSKKIPAYMVPNFIYCFSNMPINENGKVAVSKLEALLAFSGMSSESEVVVNPTNKFEKKLVSIWVNILDQSNIGVNQDFFMLGGQSLQATQVLYDIEKQFGVKLSLVDFYEAPIIISLVEKIKKYQLGRKIDLDENNIQENCYI